MVRAAYLEYEYFLRTVLNSRTENVSTLLKVVNNKVIHAVIEIAYNILKGFIPLNKVQIRYFKKEKLVIKSLIKKNKSVHKKLVLLQENPTIVKHILRSVL